MHIIALDNVLFSFFSFFLFFQQKSSDKSGIKIIFFLFLHEDILCGYSLEVPHRGTSNEYPQHHMFTWTNNKKINTLRFKKASY